MFIRDMTPEQRREVRKRGGLDYRDVTVRKGGLYVGRIGIGADADYAEALDRWGFAYLPRVVAQRLGVSERGRTLPGLIVAIG